MRGFVSGEVAFYLANCSLAAKRAGTAVRCHWHVENTLHYTRDVTFQEDRSRIRHNPGVFARLRLNHPLIFSRVIPIGWGRTPSSHYPDSG